MNKISEKEKKMLLLFIERNVRPGPDPHSPDEGIGTVYERIVLDEYFRGLLNRYDIKTVLEHPADGVTGVPGINSLEFARHSSCKVTLTNPSELMLDGARVVWEREKLLDNVEFVKCEIDELPFSDNSFDLSWNFCIFEKFSNPNILVAELKRVSKKYVMVLTQNKYNLGTIVHFLYHKFNSLEWDHGFTNLMTMKSILKVMKDNDLEVLEKGSIDTPPWLDTWDMPLRGELKKLLGKFGIKWQWETKTKEAYTDVVQSTSTNTATSKIKKDKGSKLINFCIWIEKNLPQWFAYFQTHHLYVLARKK